MTAINNAMDPPHPADDGCELSCRRCGRPVSLTARRAADRILRQAGESPRRRRQLWPICRRCAEHWVAMGRTSRVAMLEAIAELVGAGQSEGPGKHD